MSSVRKTLAIGFLFLASTGGALFLYFAMYGGGGEPEHATLLPAPMPLPAFELIDQDGASFTPQQMTDRWSLVFFGFTHCPDICPATLQQLAIARDRVQSDGGNFPDIVLISVDPERDDAAVMRAYVQNFGDGIKGVTGAPENLQALTKALGIFVAKSDLPNGGYTVDHSSAVLLINPSAEWHAVFTAPHTIDEFVADIPRLIGG